jgi:GDPmannose 4,6-dehydratase
VWAQWLILQQDRPEDFVIATGEQHSVREFVEAAAAELGMRIEWRGTSVEEYGTDVASGKVVIRIDPRYFRPAEVDTLLGDAARARRALGWTPRTTFAEIVREMVGYDLRLLETGAARQEHDNQIAAFRRMSGKHEGAELGA